MTSSTFPSLPPAEPRSPSLRGVRHVIAVGGGRGGVGKSMLAVNLAVYLAQLGRKVVLVDADAAGAELHTMLDIELPRAPTAREDLDEFELLTHPTPVPGLVLLPQIYTVGSIAPLRPGRKPRWASRLRQLDADYVLLDLGAGTLPATVDLALSSDFMLLVTSPEPPSVEATFRFTRALFLRSLRRALVRDRFRIRMVERAQNELPPLPSPRELVYAIARYDSGVAELAAIELGKLKPRLVVNNVKLRADADLGPNMCEVGRRYLGCEMDYVGQIEQDDSVWLSISRRRPLLIDSPTSKSARNIERIARRTLALAASRDPSGPELPIKVYPSDPTLYEVLGAPRGATDEELRRAYKRQKGIYQPKSLVLTSLLDEQGLKLAQAQTEEAHDTLLDPVRRRAYDLSTFPETEEEAIPRDPAHFRALEAERAMLREELSREINAETEFSGPLLRKVRESLGVELEDIAAHTKISSTHLLAIENEDFAALPALVYTRGFVQQLAHYLKLDSTQVTRTYLQRMRQWRNSSERPSSL
ncbi:MAG: helix-turn-helix domain-containing protein [Polyangiaceae bacterium]|nr:helix-turn-helix domain-containing protein [Polyangiaceae bacterium]